MTADTFERVRRVAADVLQVEPARLSAAAPFRDFDDFDSIRQLNLVLALEQEFGVQLEPEEMEQATDCARVAELIERKPGGK
jgi:acyl carrier protein